MAEEKGVWRTIKGRRVFIREGEDLASAMKRSGKFDNLNNKPRTISKEEYDKKPKDYKGTLKELVDTAKFRGENPDELRKMYEKMGYDVDKDKTILELGEDGGTRLSPVKVDEKTISKEKAEAFASAFKTALEEEQNGYTQKVDWDGGTYQYSKAQLDRMKESGIKPMEHSYTGGGWEGTNYDSKLTTKEIAKTINDYIKKKYPDVKLSRKTDYNSIDVNIMSSEKDLYITGNDIAKMSDNDVTNTIRDSVGGFTRFDDWLNENNKKSANGTYTINASREYLTTKLEEYKNRKGDRVKGNEWYLSDYGKNVVGDINKKLNSYNYDDSDGMVDYFDTNFYDSVEIGRWDKPYQLNTKNKDISPMSEYSDTTGTGLSDRQHTTLSKMSLSELRKTAQEYNIDTTGLSRQKLMAKLIAIFK